MNTDTKEIQRANPRAVVQNKRCTTCQELKADTEFYIDRTKGVTRNACRKCLSAKQKQRNESGYNKAYYKKNKIRIQAIKRKCTYGLDDSVYQEMLLSQNFRCAACGDETKLVVDHCHNTGRVRGLLCRCCNTALGQLQDSKVRVEGLLRYISNG